ncbi:hypothetical protein ACFYUV_38020 [Nonomuraea sp. NPDC003560]|uniref:hypothetical protein n=1 Tax=Nonomuraea sp. NPDC003560 TaxID=3364341 RepID=UPI00367DE0C1
MDLDPERDRFASIITPAGSVVTLPFLTEQQAQGVAAQYGPLAESLPRHVQGAAEEKDCSRCQGQGSWEETVEVKTPSGGTVTTRRRVNCRPCGGTGKVPK